MEHAIKIMQLEDTQRHTFHFATSSREHSGCASLTDRTETVTAYCVVLKYVVLDLRKICSVLRFCRL
jgi:hypothetical protein